MADLSAASVELHRQHQGKLETASRVSLNDRHDLSLAYTPGVAEPCRVIAADKNESFDLTWRGRTVAVISDGSAVLGLGNIGPEAALPVMEGKAILMKQFGGFDAVPLVVEAHTAEDLIKFVRQAAPGFGGINLEDIAAPICFEVEDALQDLPIPVFHDDQHGTAIVVLAALLNAAKVVDKRFEDLKVTVVGAGAAGLAVTQLLLGLDRVAGDFIPVHEVKRVQAVRLVDSRGLVVAERPDLNLYKERLTPYLSPAAGSLADALQGADAVIGVAGPGLIDPSLILTMAERPVVLAMANPIPEIMPEEALTAGAAVVATGRSDFPNQVNNVLAFPGIFKGCLEGRISRVSFPMRGAAAEAIAALVPEPAADKIIPSPLTAGVAESVAAAVQAAAVNEVLT